MQKLISTYRANPTDASKAKLQAYIRKHPMAVCLLMPEEIALLKAAGLSI